MNPSLARRRQLRRQLTPTEIILWNHLRARRFARFKFRRQHPVGPFILDFFCVQRRLAIELDGEQHFNPAAVAYDISRDNFLADRGIRVLRFTNAEIFVEAEAVLLVIAVHLGIDLDSQWPTAERRRRPLKPWTSGKQRSRQLVICLAL